jgi:hypothetical protein
MVSQNAIPIWNHPIKYLIRPGMENENFDQLIMIESIAFMLKNLHSLTKIRNIKGTEKGFCQGVE